MVANEKERIAYLNPPELEEIARGLVAGARRFIEFERFVETLELMKAKDRPLPPAVERRIGRSMQRVLGDVRTSAMLAGELADQLDDAGVVEPLFQALARDIERSGPVSVAEILERGKEMLERELERRGMPRELWQWALMQMRGLDISLRASDGTIEASQRDVILLSIPGEEAVEPMAILAGFRAKTRRTNFTDIIRTRMREVVSLYEGRAQRTALQGIEVFPTGLAPVAIFLLVVLIIAITVIAVGVVLSVLCGNGTITDRETCAIAPYLLLVGFLLLVAVSGGSVVENERPGGGDPDPSG